MQEPPSGMFIINCKNYEEATGGNLARIVKTAQKISKKYNVKIAVAPPHHLIGTADRTALILAQHVDDAKIGSTTGHIVPELLKRSGIRGSLINHSEHRIPGSQIRNIVAKMSDLNMISVVCVRDVREARMYAKLAPNYIAIEPPDLIGSGKAVSKERPELITGAASAVKSAKNKTQLLCGAGIISGQDVSMAMKLGASGILVASGIVKSDNWNRTISEFAKSMV